MAAIDMKESILDAAERVVSEKGLADTTVDDIALAAGITREGLYYHFPTRNDMLSCAVDRYERRLLSMRGTLMTTMPHRPSSLLKATAVAIMSLPNLRNDVVVTLVGMLNEPEIRAKIADLKRRLFAGVCRTLPRSDQVAMVMMLLDGLWLARMSTPPLYPEHCVKKIYADLLEYIDMLSEDGWHGRSYG